MPIFCCGSRSLQYVDSDKKEDVSSSKLYASPSGPPAAADKSSKGAPDLVAATLNSAGSCSGAPSQATSTSKEPADPPRSNPTSTSQVLQKSSSGLHRLPSGGLQKLLSSGLQKLPSGSLLKPPSNGLQKSSSSGLQKQSSGQCAPEQISLQLKSQGQADVKPVAQPPIKLQVHPQTLQQMQSQAFQQMQQQMQQQGQSPTMQQVPQPMSPHAQALQQLQQQLQPQSQNQHNNAPQQLQLQLPGQAPAKAPTTAFEQGCNDLASRVQALAGMRLGPPKPYQAVLADSARPHTADEAVTVQSPVSAMGWDGTGNGQQPWNNGPPMPRPATDDTATRSRWAGMSMAQAVASHAAYAQSTSARHSSRLSPQGSSCRLSCPRSVAQLLGVGDAAGVPDLWSPEEVTLLPLAEFTALDTTDVEAALAATEEEEQCNLLACSPLMPSGMGRKLWSLNDFELLRHLHHGYTSDVVEARCKRTGARVALKVYSLPDMTPLTRVQLLREMRLHLQLSHPNIVAMYAAFIEQGTLLEDTGGMEVRRARYNHVVIVQDFAEQGDLLRLLKRYGGVLPERVVVNEVLRPLLHALAYMHGKGVVHRDLKPGNVLFDRNGQLKLADFGLSIDISEERASTRAGTFDFMAPEVLRCPAKRNLTEPKPPVDGQPDAQPGAQYGTAADAWGVGVLVYAMLTGQPPFVSPNGNPKDVAAQILSDRPTDYMAGFSRLSPAAQVFIRLSMASQPAERPSVLEMHNLPLLQLHAPFTRSAHHPLGPSRALPFHRSAAPSVPAAQNLPPTSSPSLGGAWVQTPAAPGLPVGGAAPPQPSSPLAVPAPRPPAATSNGSGSSASGGTSVGGSMSGGGGVCMMRGGGSTVPSRLGHVHSDAAAAHTPHAHSPGP